MLCRGLGVMGVVRAEAATGTVAGSNALHGGWER